MRNKLAPSILSADFSKLGEDILTALDAGADYIHIDVMDGHFVPNLSIGFPIIQSIRPMTSAPFDVHLMVSEPEKFLDYSKKAGADIISVHAEVCTHLHRVLGHIRNSGLKAAVALNPYTPLETIKYALRDNLLDMVLQMTVDPGFGGAKCINSMTQKIHSLREMIETEAPHKEIDIEVDGGITTENVREFIDSGANIIVAGSAVFRNNISENVKTFKELMF